MFQDEKEKFDCNSLEISCNSKKISPYFAAISTKWYDFEFIAKIELAEYFTERGINVHNVYSNVKEYRDNKTFYEIDLLLFNEKYVIAVEVKSRLTKERVEEHLDRIKKILQQPPHDFKVQGKTLIGAIAAVATDSEVAELAVQSGLYLMVQKSNLIEIVNPPDFSPQEWTIE